MVSRHSPGCASSDAVRLAIPPSGDGKSSSSPCNVFPGSCTNPACCFACAPTRSQQHATTIPTARSKRPTTHRNTLPPALSTSPLAPSNLPSRGGYRHTSPPSLPGGGLALPFGGGGALGVHLGGGSSRLRGRIIGTDCGRSSPFAPNRCACSTPTGSWVQPPPPLRAVLKIQLGFPPASLCKHQPTTSQHKSSTPTRNHHSLFCPRRRCAGPRSPGTVASASGSDWQSYPDIGHSSLGHAAGGTGMALVNRLSKERADLLGLFLISFAYMI